LGVPLKWLQKQLSTLSLDSFSLIEKTVSSQGIHARHFQVKLKGEPTHRHYGDIKSLIEKSSLSPKVIQTSLSIFNQVADAESKIHGIAKNQVHFHEVGATDSIVDIVGTALCFEYLGIESVLSSKIPLGKGFIDCQHGTLPIPAPATMQILKDVPVYGSGIAAELVTPTGAAIIKTLAKDFVDLPPMIIERIGYGAGSRKLAQHPNLLRIVTGHMDALFKENMPSSGDTVIVLETSVDDMNPEIFGYLMDRLFDDGALDVYWIPVYMKKNRPGTLIQVLCNPGSKTTLINRILRETTSTGVRHHAIHRTRLTREVVTVATRFGNVQMKKITNPDGRTRLVPEYESCKKIALAHNMPIRRVYQQIDRETALPNTSQEQM
jgi:pyridinium-3,5-bisthiocarboxylic acid mononucleotide nickel chelatase